MNDNEVSYRESGKGKINTPASYKQEFEWLKEVDAQALVQEQQTLKQSYINFYKKSNSFFKAKIQKQER